MPRPAPSTQISRGPGVTGPPTPEVAKVFTVVAAGRDAALERVQRAVRAGRPSGASRSTARRATSSRRPGTATSSCIGPATVWA